MLFKLNILWSAFRLAAGNALINCSTRRPQAHAFSTVRHKYAMVWSFTRLSVEVRFFRFAGSVLYSQLCLSQHVSKNSLLSVVCSQYFFSHVTGNWQFVQALKKLKQSAESRAPDVHAQERASQARASWTCAYPEARSQVCTCILGMQRMGTLASGPRARRVRIPGAHSGARFQLAGGRSQ